MNTSLPTSSEWMQFYEQTVDDELSASASLGFSDATVVATTGAVLSGYETSTTLHSATDPLTSTKATSSTSKAVRRRSRTSKKTPTTLLNANPSNFRALVQQFTGCPRAPFSLGSRRSGPINLNFAIATEPNNQSGMAASIMSASGNDYNHNHQPSHQEQQQDKPASDLLQQQQHQHAAVSFHNVHHDSLFNSTTSSSGRAHADQILEGFDDLPNISHFQEFHNHRDVVPYSNQNIANDSDYFL